MEGLAVWQRPAPQVSVLNHPAGVTCICTVLNRLGPAGDGHSATGLTCGTGQHPPPSSGKVYAVVQCYTRCDD
jgi:hypothetical protein